MNEFWSIRILSLNFDGFLSLINQIIYVSTIKLLRFLCQKFVSCSFYFSFGTKCFLKIDFVLMRKKKMAVGGWEFRRIFWMYYAILTHVSELLEYHTRNSWLSGLEKETKSLFLRVMIWDIQLSKSNSTSGRKLAQRTL